MSSYVLTSSGGLWKTTNFSQPRPAWTATTDAILSTSGGNAALGANPDTIYLGTGDPFDPGVGGYARRSTDGGQTWSAATKLGASTVVPEVKADTSGPADVVMMGTNAGLFRSADGGQTYGAAPVLSGLIWSLARTSADGWQPAPSGRTARSWYPPTRGRHGPPYPTPEAAYSGAGRTTLAVARPGDSVVYAFAANTGNAAQRDLFRSTDGGLNWTAIGLGQYVTTPGPNGPVTTWVGKVPTNPNADSRTWTSWPARRSTTTWCSSIRTIRRATRCTSAAAELGEIDGCGRHVDPGQQLARPVQAAVRARRLPCRGVHHPQR